jgi:hypothetical protein
LAAAVLLLASVFFSSGLAAADVAMSDTPDAKQLDAMLEELRTLCPVLRPSVVPAGYDDRAKGTALAALCSQDGRGRSERAALASMLEEVRRGRKTCELTQQDVSSEAQLRFASFWDLEPADGTMRLRGCAFVSLETALLLDPLLMLDRFSAPESDVSDLRDLTAHFCKVNRRDDLCSKPARSLEWLQQCYSLAFACRVLASNLGAWTITDANGVELTQPVDRIVAGLLGNHPTAKRVDHSRALARTTGRATVGTEAAAPAAATAKAKGKNRSSPGVVLSGGVTAKRRKMASS